MNRRINWIILLFETRDGRHFAFRMIRCRDGRMVEGKVSGGESNIKTALTHDGKEWRNDYFWTKKPMCESELFALPYAGCSPDEIRTWVAREFRKRQPIPA